MSIPPLANYYPIFSGRMTTPFQERVDHIVHQIEASQLISQANLNHFISKFRTTSPEDHRNQTWLLCYLLHDVLYDTLMLTHHPLSVNQLVLFCRQVQSLVEEINSPDDSIDEILFRYQEMKVEKERERRCQELSILIHMNSIGRELEILARQKRTTEEYLIIRKALILELPKEDQALAEEKLAGDLDEAMELQQAILQHVRSLQEKLYREMPLED